MFFGAAERISKAIADDHDPRGAEVSVVIIRMSQIGMLDATGAHTLAELAEELESRGITVIIKGVQPEHLTLLANMGIVEALRHENHLIDSLDEAIAHARSHVNRRCTHEKFPSKFAWFSTKPGGVWLRHVQSGVGGLYVGGGLLVTAAVLVFANRLYGEDQAYRPVRPAMAAVVGALCRCW